MRKGFYFFLVLVFCLVSDKMTYANVYASGIRISDDTVSTYTAAANTWSGDFTSNSAKIWFIINEAGGGSSSLTATVEIKDGSTVVKTINVTNPDKGVNSVLWDGTDDSNLPVANGTYSFSIKVADNVGHSSFDSVWVAGSHVTSSTDLEGSSSFAYRGNASITDPSQQSFGNLYVSRGTSSANGMYELRADGFYNTKIGTDPAWPNSVPNELATVGGAVYGLAGYGYTGGGFARGFESSTGAYIDSIGFGTSSVRGLVIRMEGSDTVFYTCRGALAGENAILRKVGVNGDTATYINMQQYMSTSTTSGYIKSLAFDDEDNLYVAFGDASTSRSKLAKFNASGDLVWLKELSADYSLASGARFHSLAIYHGQNATLASDDILYALVYSPTETEWGIYSVNPDGSSITLLTSPLGRSTSSTAQIINVDAAGNVIWSNGSASERITEFSPASGANSFTTPAPDSVDIKVVQALPVELTNFSAKVNNNSVELQWSTATEVNNSGFEIERKVKDAWQKIGFVKGSGSSTKLHKYSFVDNKINEGGKFTYRLKQVDFDGTATYSKEVEVNVALPNKFELSQNYPNPFNPTTVIRYTLTNTSKVRLEVYSITGQLVSTIVNGLESAGMHEVKFNGKSLASGTYIYRLTAGNLTLIKKMVLMK